MSSRLFSEVRERRGLAYYVYGLNHSYTDAGTLYAQAGVDIGRIDEAVATIAGELRKIASEPIPAEELEKARSFAKGRFVLQLETPQGLMLFGLRREVLEQKLPDPDEVLSGIDAVTGEDVARVASDLISARAAEARRHRPLRRARPVRAAPRRLTTAHAGSVRAAAPPRHGARHGRRSRDAHGPRHGDRADDPLRRAV